MRDLAIIRFDDQRSETESGKISSAHRLLLARLGAVGLLLLAFVATRGHAQELASGGAHSCAIVEGGAVKCWGFNISGQLGDAANAVYSTGTPVDTLGPVGVIMLDGGGEHTCALVTGGTARCWGANLYGQLANSGFVGGHTPDDVLGVSAAIAVSAGGQHSCALLVGGAVKCWGHGQHGQLGDGGFANSSTPVDVVGVSGATAIALGGEHSCAVVSGAVKCWGRNNVGQLGNGVATPDPGVASVVDVGGLSGVQALAAGYNHTCALLSGGAVKCWGSAGLGKLGDGNQIQSFSAVPVTAIGGGDATALDIGRYHSCALFGDGTVNCWGSNYFGQLGNGENRNDKFSPVLVLGIDSATALAVGDNHTCVRVSISPLNLKCWGDGGLGQLGDGVVGNGHENYAPAYVIGTPFDSIFGERGGSFEEP